MKNNVINDIKQSKSKVINKFDIIFICLLIAVIILCYFITANQSAGSYAEIYSEGRIIKVMPLDIDAEYEYTYEGGYNIIKVSGGKICVSSADCNDKTCMHYPPSDIAGSVIICLPHKLTVVIRGTEGIDGVAG